MRSKNPPTPPDTIAGTVRADDPDGLDSVWVSVDLVLAGEDGGLRRTFSAPFRFTVGSGKPPTTRIPITIRARDIAGFEASRDTFVTVVP